MFLRKERGALVLAVALASACSDDPNESNDAGGANTTGGTQGSNNTGGSTAGSTGDDNTGNNNNTGDNNGNTSGTSGSNTSSGTNGTNTSGTNTSGTTGDTTGGTTGNSTGGQACSPSAAPTIGKLGFETVKSGLDRLVYASQPPGSTDWYLVQQGGKIIVLSGTEQKATPFLDVSSEIGLSGTEDERGLLGLAFPSDYATSGKFYISMTITGSGTGTDVVREYTRSSADPFVADAASKKQIVELPSSAVNHNGGIARFGPDGKLYIGTGDGGASCSSNQPGASQDVSKLFGKILRLDPSKTAPDNGADGNPFAADGDGRVFHYGLRNPFRFNFDRGTGDLYIGDVGQDDFEEVSFAAMGTSGLNFGWPAYEADALTSTTCKTSGAAFTLRTGSTHTPPIFKTDRKAPNADANFGDWKSVIGGVVYRGSALPALTGVYFFGDYQGARMAALCKSGATTSPVTPFAKTCDPNMPNQGCLVAKSGAAAIVELMAIVEGNDGEIYMVANHSTLLKVVPN